MPRSWSGASTEAESERRTILEQLLGGTGSDSTIEPPFFCNYGRNTHLGDDVYPNSLCTILDNNEVPIGQQVDGYG
jgi:maltose O-acetyltransferase